MPIPDLIDHYAQTFLRSAEAKGYERAEILERPAFGLHEAYSEAFSPQALARISRRTKLLLSDEFFGLTQNGCRLGSYRLLCEMCVLSERLGDALHRGVTFMNMVTHELQFALEERKGTVQITVLGGLGDNGAVLREWWLLIWHRLAQWVIGEEIPITSASFSHSAHAAIVSYREVFTSSLWFNTANTCLIFPIYFLDRPVNKSLQELGEIVGSPTIDLRSTSGVRQSTRSLLRERLKTQLETSQDLPTFDEIAAELGTSTQTLRRRLRGERTSYAALKKEVREIVALRWLADESIPLNRLSVIAGYSEPSGFGRAVKQWTGISLQEYRAKIRRWQRSDV